MPLWGLYSLMRSPTSNIVSEYSYDLPQITNYQISGLGVLVVVRVCVLVKVNIMVRVWIWVSKC